MKSRLFILAAFLLSLATAPLTRAEDKPKNQPTELESRMDKLNGSWRKLRRQVSDPAKNADSLALVAAIREASAGTEKMTPIKAADVPEADRAKFQADYAAGMMKFASLLDQLETALKSNNNEEAGKLVAAIADFQRESHKAFRRPPPEKPKS